MKKNKVLESVNQANISTFLAIQESLGRGTWWRTNNVGVYDPVKKVYRKPRGKLQRNGISDIAGVLWGVPIFIEVKSSVGTLSHEQKLFRDDVERNGGVFIMARGVSCLEWIFDAEKLRRYLNEKRQGTG